jgi:hypothetical protein
MPSILNNAFSAVLRGDPHPSVATPQWVATMTTANDNAV